MAYNDKSAEATPAKAQSYLLAQDECAELLFWARSQKGAREARFEKRRLYLDSDTYALAQGILHRFARQAMVWLESAGLPPSRTASGFLSPSRLPALAICSMQKYPCSRRSF